MGICHTVKGHLLPERSMLSSSMSRCLLQARPNTEMALPSILAAIVLEEKRQALISVPESIVS